MQLKTPRLKIPCNSRTRRIVFDRATNLIYTQNDDLQFLVFHMNGLKLGEYNISPPLRGVSARSRGLTLRVFEPHPKGNRLCVLARDKLLYLVELPGAPPLRDASNHPEVATAKSQETSAVESPAIETSAEENSGAKPLAAIPPADEAAAAKPPADPLPTAASTPPEAVAMPTEAKPDKSTSASKDSFRIWSDASGKFRVSARLIEIRDDVVVLEKEDGKRSEVPIAKLSQLDQNLIARQRQDSE